jgi:hypothetical protein
MRNVDGIIHPQGYPRKSIIVPEYKLRYVNEIEEDVIAETYFTLADYLLGLSAAGLAFYWYWGFVLDGWYK